MQLLFPLILFGGMYAFMIRPQRRRLAEQRALLASVAVGDRVMTTSGLYGVVVSETEEVLVLGVAPGVDLHVARGAVSRKVADDAPGAPAVEDLVGVEADSIHTDSIHTDSSHTDSSHTDSSHTDSSEAEGADHQGLPPADRPDTSGEAA